MKRSYRLYELSEDEFEVLVARICKTKLGIGVITFTKGKDGGRDGTFEGTAENFPSKASPLIGKFIIQAKSTSSPVASCSDKDFERIIKKEIPKIKKLVESGELDHYLLFTNRKKAAIKFTSLIKLIKDIGSLTAHILGNEEICQFLDEDPKIWEDMGFDKYETPFHVNPNDLATVIKEFHFLIKDKKTDFDSSKNLKYTKIKKKNKINGLSKEFDDYIRKDSLPYFSEIKAFLENPRNEALRSLYHDTADELKQKIIVSRNRFDTFDEVLTFAYDLMIQSNPEPKEMRRYNSLFLHYMYYDCDIGQHA